MQINHNSVVAYLRSTYLRMWLAFATEFRRPKTPWKSFGFFQSRFGRHLLFSSRNVTVVVVAAAAAVDFIESKCTASASRCYVFVKRSRWHSLTKMQLIHLVQVATAAAAREMSSTDCTHQPCSLACSLEWNKAPRQLLVVYFYHLMELFISEHSTNLMQL